MGAPIVPSELLLQKTCSFCFGQDTLKYGDFIIALLKLIFPVALFEKARRWQLLLVATDNELLPSKNCAHCILGAYLRCLIKDDAVKRNGFRVEELAN